MTPTEFFVIFIPALVISNGYNNETKDALTATTQAIYHADEGVREASKRIEQKYVPEYIKRNAWIYTLTYNAIKDQQINYTWTF